jgi:glyoxylase-like metal-dependent hydrolase (beta-lactamase superfamily II)/rhodanese-related sulfurtransferase
MELLQFWFDGLAQASYLLVDGRDAIVVDPALEIEQYMDAAAARGAAICHIVETHIHADFVSGHVELAEATGARLWMGPGAATEFPAETLEDGAEVTFGSRVLRALATPGHTPESVTLLVPPRTNRSEDGPAQVLTGDTLFVGDVGRPDLTAGGEVTPADMARSLYASITEKLLRLPDDTRVFPAHGAGSLCGKCLGSARWTTIGAERLANPALNAGSEEEFVSYVTRDLPAQPAYFRRAAACNRRGPLRRAAYLTPLAALTSDAAARAIADGAVVLDTRDPEDFARGHVPGAIGVGLSAWLGPWAGTVLPDRPIVLCSDAGTERAAALELLRVGFERPLGYIAGGMSAWAAERSVATLPEIPVAHLRSTLGAPGAPRVLDVRAESEWNAGHIRSALHAPLTVLPARLAAGALDPRESYAVICGSGYRSSIAASLLRRAGIANVANIPGGMSALEESGQNAALMA